MLSSFVIILQSCYKKIVASQNPKHHITVATIFCNHLANLLQRLHESKHHMPSFVIILQSNTKIASNRNATSHHAMFCIILQIVTKHSMNRSIASHKILHCIMIHDLLASSLACILTRPRNPRFKDVHTGTKRRLDVKTSNRDSGISGSDPH
jgi:hypothetical protein